jgi:tetratricopeptide (TPR) repeat protein
VSGPRFNPFPGLRPFEAEDDYLFFGREPEIDELLRRLRTTRFLSVIGSSGSGKSSLIRAGLIPSLISGAMAGAGAGWRIATFRPGENPIGNLAMALSPPRVLGSGDPELADTQPVLIEATLRRGLRGLVDSVRMARLPKGENVLVVVDQFEELFRYHRNENSPETHDEAIAFVKVLLEAARQTDLPIYVIITMRSDFIGDCIHYPGLTDAVNDGQYLVPRMGRDALRVAITGPVAVGGGTITPRLVLRLLNDIGDDHDQLPVLQHALMRTWDQWLTRNDPDGPLDVDDYESVGTLRQALSLHAEETYQQVGSDRAREVAERVFKALTDTFSDPRGVRRPASISDLSSITGATETEVAGVVDAFRQPGRSFLMPPAPAPLTPASIVDVSHESLMRCWDRLVKWAEEERAAAAFYARLAQAAEWHAQGTAGLWRDPELELALRWRASNQPTAAWAARYDDRFEQATAFLDASAIERGRERAAREQERRRKLQRVQLVAGVLALLLMGAVALAVIARRENRRAEENLRLARAAVDETLASADIDLAAAGADVPQITEFRRALLGKAKQFYVEFLKQNPSGIELRREMALAHYRLGHIARLLERRDEAAAEYRAAIEQFEALERERPEAAQRQSLANAFNWLGETLRPIPGSREAAATAYERALALQGALATADPSNMQYRQELARTHYNRGILWAMSDDASGAAARASEADFKEAIRVLEPLASSGMRGAAQELARTFNNLANLISAEESRLAEAAALYARAISIHEGMLRTQPDNREYKLELAKFLNNDAEAARVAGDFERGRRRNAQALELLDELLRPAPTLGIEHADAHNLRGRILAAAGSPEAESAYRQALQLFEALDHNPDARLLGAFHERFSDLLLNLAALVAGGGPDTSRRMLTDAITHYIAHANASLDAGNVADARLALANLSQVVAALGDREKSVVLGAYQRLEQRLQSAR